MANKCPPGVFCIENMTVTVLIVVLLLIGILVYLRIMDTNTTKTITNVGIVDTSYKVPVNIPTSSVTEPYKQVGFLTRSNGDDTILPLYGRYIFRNRDKQQYYTISDKQNSVRLPVIYQGKSCMQEYGCNSLQNGDVVYVEGYNDAFKVTMYEDQKLTYIPYL